MTVIDSYSKRQKRLHEKQPEIYMYDTIPQKFRIQVTQTIIECFQNGYTYTMREEEIYEQIVLLLRKEFGTHQLANGAYSHFDHSYQEELFNFFENTNNFEQCLDTIELTFSIIHTQVAKSQQYIDELNTRFKENNLGYRFENNQIIRIDSELLHSEVVKPALQFLSSLDYKTANEEFLSAYDNYNKGAFKEANTYCCRAFESTMKIICSKHGYNFDNDKDTVKPLLNILKNNLYFPNCTEDHLNNLVGILQGIGTTTNKRGRHGQGTSNATIPTYLTSYLLHTTASAILLFSEIEKDGGKK